MSLVLAVLRPDAPFQPWHPLRYWGYQLWSGIGSDIAELTLITAVLATLITFWRTHNCHVHRCWRLQWHVHPVHGHPVCRHHHPEHRSIHSSPSRI